MRFAINAGRRSVEITRPDKPLFGSGITKADLASYYARVAPTMLRHISGRPLNLERYPDGIEGQRIIQQRASGHFPSWIERVEVPAREPRLFTNEQRKAKREGKLLIDIQRNAYAHTSVAPYSVRPRPAAPVATPLDWEELDDRSTRADRWTLVSVPKRLDRDGDPWR